MKPFKQITAQDVLPAIDRGVAIMGQRLGAEVQRVFDQEARCTDLYALAYPDLGQAAPESEYAAAPVMAGLKKGST